MKPFHTSGGLVEARRILLLDLADTDGGTALPSLLSAECETSNENSAAPRKFVETRLSLLGTRRGNAAVDDGH